MTLEVRPYEAGDREHVRKLALEHLFPDYAGYRRHQLDFASEEHAAQVEGFLAGAPPVAAVALRRGEPVGFAGAAPLDWETSHFGIAMASIPFVLARGSADDRAAIGGTLVGHVAAAMRERGSLHLALRPDVQDLPTLGAAQERGFRVMDTIVTYLGQAAPPRPDWVSEHFPDLQWEVRAGRDLVATDPAEVEPFVEFMREGYRNDRFHADHRLPRERSDELYVEWFRKVFRGEWATGVQFVRKRGRIVGFCSFQEAREIRERYGARIIGRGLAGVLPEGRGAYALLAENISTRCPVGSRFQEFDTQIQNLPVINVWIRRGMPFFRARHTLHRWLDD